MSTSSGWTSSDGPARERKAAAQWVFRPLSRVPGAAALCMTWGAVEGLSFSSQAVVPSLRPCETSAFPSPPQVYCAGHAPSSSDSLSGGSPAEPERRGGWPGAMDSATFSSSGASSVS